MMTTDYVITYSPARTNNYKVLRNLSSILKVAAWLSGIGSVSIVLTVLAALIIATGTVISRYGSNYDFSWIWILGGFLGSFLFVSGVVSTLLFAFLSESVSVMLDVEANSRQAAKTLERLLRSQDSE
jgi:hypothetical protein